MKKAIGNGSKVKYKFPYFTLIDLSKIRILDLFCSPALNYSEYTTFGSQAHNLKVKRLEVENYEI